MSAIVSVQADAPKYTLLPQDLFAILLGQRGYYPTQRGMGGLLSAAKLRAFTAP